MGISFCKVKVHNRTDVDISMSIIYDRNPKKFPGWKEFTIPVGGSVKRKGIVGKNWPFTVKYQFKNGTVDEFHVNVKSASKFECNPIFKETHIIDLNPNVKGNRLEITIRNNPQYLENQQTEARKREQLKRNDEEAITLNDEGIQLLVEQRFEEAVTKFGEASILANKASTVTSINTNLVKSRTFKDDEEKAESLNREGKQLRDSHNYEEALMKFREAEQLAKKKTTATNIGENLVETRRFKSDQEKAEVLNTEGMRLHEDHQYEKSLKIFEEASVLAKRASTVTSINKNLVQARTFLADQEKAESLNKEGMRLRDSHQFEDAKKKFEEASILAKEASTITSINEHIVEIRALKASQDKAEALNMEGMRLHNNHQYEKASRKFEEASVLAKRASTVVSINKNLVQARTFLANQETAESLNMEGMRLRDNHQFEDAKKKFEEASILAKEASTITSINENIVEIRALKASQDKAEALNMKGVQLHNNHQYEKASKKFEEASVLAKRASTVISINENLVQARTFLADQKRAESLNKEGTRLRDRHRYEEALKKFEAASILAKKSSTVKTINKNLIKTKSFKAKQENVEEMGPSDCYEEAPEAVEEGSLVTNISDRVKSSLRQKFKSNPTNPNDLLQDGLRLMATGANKNALKKLTKAAKIATDEELVRSIRIAQADILHQQGKELLTEFYNAETSQKDGAKSKKAAQKLHQAKIKFENAVTFQDKEEHRKSLHLVNNRIEGNQIYNEAAQLEIETFELLKNMGSAGDCEKTLVRYTEIRRMYEEARKKFEETHEHGDMAFTVVGEDLMEVDEISTDLKSNLLMFQIDEVTVVEHREEIDEANVDSYLNTAQHTFQITL